MLFAQRKGGNNLWGHPVEKWTSRRVAKVSSSSVDGPPASRNKTDKSVGVWPVDRPTASPSVSVADFCLCRLSSSRPSSRLPVLAGDTVTLATSKFFQPITITGITNWIRFVKRKTMSPLVAPPCEPIQPCKSFLFISLKKESDDEAAQIFIIIQSIRLDSTGFSFNLNFFRNWRPNESRFLPALTVSTLFFFFFTDDCLCICDSHSVRFPWRRTEGNRVTTSQSAAAASSHHGEV